MKLDTRYILYIYVSDVTKGDLMAAPACENLNEKLAKIYSEKVTVNLDNRSTLSPDDFWRSMQMVASTNQAFIQIVRHQKPDQMLIVE